MAKSECINNALNFVTLVPKGVWRFSAADHQIVWEAPCILPRSGSEFPQCVLICFLHFCCYLACQSSGFYTKLGYSKTALYRSRHFCSSSPCSCCSKRTPTEAVFCEFWVLTKAHNLSFPKAVSNSWAAAGQLHHWKLLIWSQRQTEPSRLHAYLHQSSNQSILFIFTVYSQHTRNM